MYAVVPAGGSGTRLWPLSRAGHPKFLHPLGGDARSLLRATVDRLAPLAGAERTFVVTGAGHAAAVARELPDVPADNILVEPAARDSAPAIGLAAALIHRLDPGAVMGSFAADHVVRREGAFLAAVRTAVAAARADYLVTIGITPTAPETGYGYIRRDAPFADIPGAAAVGEFLEKPPREVAERYLSSGDYLWNASMFVWRAATFLAELERQCPELAGGLRRIADDWDGPDREETLARIWPTLPKTSVDVAIMEGAAARGRVAVVPADPGWTDVGDWDALAAVLPVNGDRNAVLGDPGHVVPVDTHGAVLVPSAGRVLVTLGMTDVVVVDSGDALLVCPRARAQDVRGVVEALRASGHEQLV